MWLDCGACIDVISSIVIGVQVGIREFGYKTLYKGYFTEGCTGGPHVAIRAEALLVRALIVSRRECVSYIYFIL